MTFTGSGGVSGVSVTSVGFTTNAGYNGLSNTGLLDAGQTLTVGQVKTIRLTVTVTPGSKMGTYNNQATAAGTAPGAITVTDPSDNGVDPDPNGNNNANETAENDPTPVNFNEHPAIGVAKSVAAVKDNGGNSYTVVYTLLVENLGDVALTNVQVTDNLAATFPTPATFTAASASSTDFTVNAGYNGGASPTPNTNLLAAGQTLAVGQTKLIQVTVTVNSASTTTTYNNQAVATGTSPLSPVGAVVSDPSDNGVDPDPDGDRNANEPGENDPTPVKFRRAAGDRRGEEAGLVHERRRRRLHRGLRHPGEEPGQRGAEQRAGDGQPGRHLRRRDQLVRRQRDERRLHGQLDRGPSADGLQRRHVAHARHQPVGRRPDAGGRPGQDDPTDGDRDTGQQARAVQQPGDRIRDQPEPARRWAICRMTTHRRRRALNRPTRTGTRMPTSRARTTRRR